MKSHNVKFLKWLNYENLEEELKEELLVIQDNDIEIAERFYKNLEFGTAGLRGIIGAGTNRMNIYTVRKATQGLANILNQSQDNPSVVIAYDSRHKSKEFALQTALVLAKNNIKAYIFKKITATPLLSYAISELNTSAGIVITASHNPKEYNGYKVYWKHGGQITDDLADAITSEINNIEDELLVNVLDKKEAKNKNLLIWLDDEIFNSYIHKTKQLILNKKIINQIANNIKIVYTPLHGTGNEPVSNLLKAVGFNNFLVVPEQVTPDGDFPTVKYPNPEEPAAFDLALKFANKNDTDIIMATDPDADRIGVMAKDSFGQYVLLSGNQLGALLIDYILKMRKANNNLPSNGVIIKTIVTSNMGVNIAKKYGIDYLDVLTGFKYIGEKIAQYSLEKNQSFLFGYEESYGFLIGDYVRDKDAVQTCLLVAEMAAYYKTRGINLPQRLEQLFEQFGYYQESLVNINLSGIEGQKRIDRIMNTLRQNTPKSLNKIDVTIAKDYLEGTENFLKTGQKKGSTLPKCNVLHYTLEDESWVCIRPSGTEPKLKIYFGVKALSPDDSSRKIENYKKEFLAKVEVIN